MATIEKHLALTLIRSNGRYLDDPVPVRIYEYTRRPHMHHNTNLTTCYAVFYRAQDDDMWQSPFVQDAQLLWANGSITFEGAIFVRNNTDGSA